MSNKVDLKKLIQAGVHFGHQTSRWNPKMAPYIWGYKNNVHLIDVSKTAFQLEKAVNFLQSVTAEGKTILWVGTKKAAQEVIQNAATTLNMPFVNHRWIGGSLSNHSQVKKSVTKMLHYEDIIAKSDLYPHYTKKEFNVFSKMVSRLIKNVGGIRSLQWPVGAVVIVDVTKERSALKEAVSMGIPVVAIVDTNGDPSSVDFVIPANDDVPRSVGVILDYLVQGAQRGKTLAVEQGKEKVVRTAKDENVGPVMDEQVALVLATEDDEEADAKAKRKAGEEKKLVKKPVNLVEEDEASLKLKADKAKAVSIKVRTAEKTRSE